MYLSISKDFFKIIYFSMQFGMTVFLGERPAHHVDRRTPAVTKVMCCFKKLKLKSVI